MSEEQSIMTKEDHYDAEIFPLMAQIIAICQKNKINMAATFSLGLDPNYDDQPLYCTTALAVDKTDEDGFRKIAECVKVMKAEPQWAAFTIHSGEQK